MDEDQIIIAARKKATLAERSAFLDEACQDPSQRRRIEQQLNAEQPRLPENLEPTLGAETLTNEQGFRAAMII